MPYAYKLNEDVHHQSQGPQGRASTDAPAIYTIVQLMPIEADGRLRYRIKNKALAAFLITTEAMIAELPKKAAGGPAMPPGGGMGGMDF